MRRMFTTALLALTISAVQAGPSEKLAARIHDAAVAACTPQRARGALPQSRYGVIDDHCVYRISRSAIAKYEALDKAKADGQVAKN